MPSAFIDLLHGDAILFAERAQLSLSSEDLFGICDEKFELRLPSDLKDALRRAATARGMKLAPWIRLELAKAALGQAHVMSVLAAHMGLVPDSPPDQPPQAVPTTRDAEAANGQ